MEWGWPQWVFAGLYAAAIILNAAYHNQPKTGDYNVLSTIIATAIGAFVLHKGGFW